MSLGNPSYGESSESPLDRPEKITYSLPMGSKRTDILEVICPACGQEHKVPADRFRTDLSRATMQCARCKTMFALSDRGVKERPKPTGPNTKVLVFILAVIVALGILMFLVYIAKVTGKDPSLDALPEQIEVALFGDETAAPGTAQQGLIPSVDEGYKLVLKDKDPVLVVKGKIKNPGSAVRTRVLLEGRIVDAGGKVRFVTRAPCGKLIANKRIKRTERGAFSKLFTRRGEFIDCSLKPGEEKPFQMIFDDIPKDYNEAYTVQVKTLFAGHERVQDGTDSE